MKSNSKSILPVSRNSSGDDGGGGGDESESVYGDVYVASMALKVPNGPARWVLQAADAIGVGDDFHHFLTIVQPPSKDIPVRLPCRFAIPSYQFRVLQLPQ